MTYQSTLETDPGDMRRPFQTEAMDENSVLGKETELRLILVGKSGGGKSATGNTILGRKAFESLLSAKATTLRCQKEQGAWQGRTISVIDTPAIFDAEGYNEIVRREIKACVELSRPGPHSLIFVTQVGRFTNEDKTAANCVWNTFGSESTRHTIVLFTCVEDLGGEPLQEYVRKSDNRNLRDLIRQCRNRFCGFNNKAEGAQRENQVSELMKIVQRTVSANEGGYYTNRLYKMSNVQDEDVKEFLAMEKTGRGRAAWRRCSNTKLVIYAILGFLLLAIVIGIILLIRR